MNVRKLAALGVAVLLCGIGLSQAGDLKTGARDTSFYVKNGQGIDVAGMDTDSFGNGIMGIASPAGAPDYRWITLIQQSGSAATIWFGSNGKPKFALDGDAGVVPLGGDVAEAFPAGQTIPEGSVVVIDADHPGRVKMSGQAYDRRVAGVVAGTTEYTPAITLRGLAEQENPAKVTLTGTTYCLATNANGAIKAGDLLTTSKVPGHAMRVTDYNAAHGAILGKAMQDLKGDTGKVLILASLQ